MSNHPIFEGFVIGLIIISSIILAIDDPTIDPISTFETNIKFVDTIITYLFTFECFIKIIAYGLIINGKNSYLRSLSNLMGNLLRNLQFKFYYYYYLILLLLNN